MLGECCRKLAEFGEAVGAYERMLKLNPRDAETWVRIAECHLQEDLLDAAQDAIEKALAYQPDNQEAQYLQKHLGEMRTPHKPGN